VDGLEGGGSLGKSATVQNNPQWNQSKKRDGERRKKKGELSSGGGNTTKSRKMKETKTDAKKRH